MAPGRVGCLGAAMAAAVRQGRDSWCQSGASPPEGQAEGGASARVPWLAEGAM
eukprot:CAMPEP_0119476214 /NCGR_PEP_ID=MMETSP1344-20130328/6815_1 /TAXON_ID=236787 /ORGANISM="Florenciella parvula, Strain CCMP2471" /LENGTH=52 /DNA_ID=CAMNT_0007509919 /DNA_START=472 /DNA_END=630 /DNA_ORIENTATION=+